MQVIICYAFYGLNEYEKSYGITRNIISCELDVEDKVIRLNTGSDREIIVNSGSPYMTISKEILDKPRNYASVMYEKIKAINECKYIEDDFILFNIDPDTYFNHHIFDFARMIFKENNIDYASFLRGPGVVITDKTAINLSGFRFFRHPSAMGNSLVTRWSVFKKDIEDYFNYYKVTGENDNGAGGFDQTFFRFLSTEKKKEKVVYTLRDFSLQQHCNLKSAYIGSRKDALTHMYGINFDPRMNPFEFQGVR